MGKNKAGVLIIGLGFLLSVNLISAFLSPSTLTIVAASSSSFLWGLFIIMGVNIILFLKKVRKNIKIIALIFSAIILIVLFIMFAQKFNTIRAMNNVYVDVPLMEHEIDLNTITPEQLSEYKIFIWNNNMKMAGLRNAQLLNEESMYSFSDFLQFADAYNISIKDRILFICDRGGISSISVDIPISKGYNASFARISRTYNESFISNYFNITFPKTSTLITVPYNGEKSTVMINFDFATTRGEPPNETISIGYEDFNADMILDKNIICLSNLHCVLTKHILNFNNITGRKIYKIPLSQEYYDSRKL